MFNFLKPTISLPANFLRTAFQTGTSLLQTCKTDAEKRHILAITANAARHTLPYTADGLDILKVSENSKIAYFLNEKGGMIIYCEYPSPSIFDLHREESLVLIGKHHEADDKSSDRDTLRTSFALLGYHTPEGLTPRAVKYFAGYDANDASGLYYKTANTSSNESLTRAFYFADLCFKRILANNAIRSANAFETSANQKSEELMAHFEALKKRNYWTLEADVKIAPNIPLDQFLEKPTATIA